MLAILSDTTKLFQDFITSHCDVFKIPLGILEDVELRAQLGKSVTKLLTSICSAIKTAASFYFFAATLIIIIAV